MVMVSGGGGGGGGGGGRRWQHLPSLMSWQTARAKNELDLEAKECLVH